METYNLPEYPWNLDRLPVDMKWSYVICPPRMTFRLFNIPTPPRLVV